MTVEHGSLVIKDGIKGNVVERTFGLARCPISRLISTPEGFISFSAVRWLHGIGATVAHLNYDGAPLLVSAPQPVVSAGLRRKQALTTRDTTLGKAIIHRLLEAQLSAQIDVLQHLDFRFAAKDAQKYASRLTDQLSADDMLGIEGMTAKHYWTALADIPVRFGVKQGVPNYWRSFGTRVSPITGTPRTAVTPGGSALNYIYGVAASEITIALYAAGLDPALGIMHLDKENRSSLAYDLIEPARPLIDQCYFEWLSTMTFSKMDFIEGLRGARYAFCIRYPPTSP